MNKILIAKNVHHCTDYITWVKKSVKQCNKNAQLPRAIAIDGQLYVHHGKGADKAIRREIIGAINGMVGRRNDGGFDSMKFRNGKATTRKRLFRKIRQQVTIRCGERRRRMKKREHRCRKEVHAEDKIRFSANLAATSSVTAGGAIAKLDGAVIAIRGVGEEVCPSHLNKMWLAWKGKIDVKTFYRLESSGECTGQRSLLHDEATIQVYRTG